MPSIITNAFSDVRGFCRPTPNVIASQRCQVRCPALAGGRVIWLTLQAHALMAIVIYPVACFTRLLQFQRYCISTYVYAKLTTFIMDSRTVSRQQHHIINRSRSSSGSSTCPPLAIDRASWLLAAGTCIDARCGMLYRGATTAANDRTTYQLDLRVRSFYISTSTMEKDAISPQQHHVIIMGSSITACPPLSRDRASWLQAAITCAYGRCGTFYGAYYQNVTNVAIFRSTYNLTYDKLAAVSRQTSWREIFITTPQPHKQ